MLCIFVGCHSSNGKRNGNQNENKTNENGGGEGGIHRLPVYPRKLKTEVILSHGAPAAQVGDKASTVGSSALFDLRTHFREY